MVDAPTFANRYGEAGGDVAERSHAPQSALSLNRRDRRFVVVLAGAL